MAELGRYGHKQHSDDDHERMKRVLLRELAYWRCFLGHDTESPICLRQLVVGEPEDPCAKSHAIDLRIATNAQLRLCGVRLRTVRSRQL